MAGMIRLITKLTKGSMTWSNSTSNGVLHWVPWRPARAFQILGSSIPATRLFSQDSSDATGFNIIWMKDMSANAWKIQRDRSRKFPSPKTFCSVELKDLMGRTIGKLRQDNSPASLPLCCFQRITTDGTTQLHLWRNIFDNVHRILKRLHRCSHFQEFNSPDPWYAMQRVGVCAHRKQ
jgi:hypothetical protein